MNWKLPALIIVLATLAGCSPVMRYPTPTPAPPPEAPVSLGDDFTLEVGQTATLDQGRLKMTFVRVDSDSRCPPDPQIQCIWAGEVKLTIKIEAKSVTGDVTLTLSGGMDSSEPMNLNGYAITLKAVEPQPAAEKQVDPASYRATFMIEKAP